MQVTETKAEGLKHEFKIVLAAKDIDEKLTARLEQVGQQVRLPGFRPGKVPTAILRKRFGQSVMGEVIEQAVNDSSNQAMLERDLRPAMQPKVEITSFEEGADLEYTMEVEVLPAIAMPDLGKIEVERRVVEIPDKDVEESLERIASQYAETKPIETPRKSQKGDVLVIDFVGKVDGEAFPGGSAEGHYLELGSSSFIEGFEDQLVGLEAGAKTEVNIRFPDEYANDQLAGKDAVFEVEIKEIREKQPRPIDDELAKQLGMDSLDALRDAVRQQIAGEFAPIARAHLKRDLLDQLVEFCEFEVPPGMVDLEFQQIWQQIQHEKEHGHLDEEDKDKSDEELEAEYRKIAERRVRLGLLLSEIGRINNIQVSQDELTQAVIAEARRMPGREREVMEFYKSNPDALGNLRAPLFEEKAIDFVVEMAKVTDKKMSPEELMQAPTEDEEATESEPKKAPAKKKKPAAKKTASKSGTKD